MHRPDEIVVGERMNKQKRLAGLRLNQSQLFLFSVNIL
jgi:hypothetical protein